MEHYCYICQEIIPEEYAEEQNRTQPPGNYLSCKKHSDQVKALNEKLRENQRKIIEERVKNK